MKKYIKLLIVFVLLISLVAVTGCGNKKDDPTADFKNPKTISYKTDKGTIKLTYDDDGTYEVEKNDPYVILRNRDNNFRIDIDYSSNTVKQQNTSKENFKKDKNYTIIDDLEFNGYKGYAMVQNEYTTTNVYLILDEENDVVSNIKVSPIMTSDATKELDKGTKPEKVLFKQEKVQQILKTVQYEK